MVCMAVSLVVTCPVCQSGDLTLITDAPAYMLHRCNTCGTVFAITVKPSSDRLKPQPAD
jgi:uncharacterized Zn finger protein